MDNKTKLIILGVVLVVFFIGFYQFVKFVTVSVTYSISGTVALVGHGGDLYTKVVFFSGQKEYLFRGNMNFKLNTKYFIEYHKSLDNTLDISKIVVIE